MEISSAPDYITKIEMNYFYRLPEELQDFIYLINTKEKWNAVGAEINDIVNYFVEVEGDWEWFDIYDLWGNKGKFAGPLVLIKLLENIVRIESTHT